MLKRLFKNKSYAQKKLPLVVSSSESATDSFEVTEKMVFPLAVLPGRVIFCNSVKPIELIENPIC